MLGPSSGETNGVSEPGPYGGGPGAGTTAESETADDVGDSAFEPDHTVEGRALRLLAEAGLSPEVVDRVPVHALVDDRRTA